MYIHFAFHSYHNILRYKYYCNLFKPDIVLFDMDKPHLLPVFDSLANALYAAQASDICLTSSNLCEI